MSSTLPAARKRWKILCQAIVEKKVSNGPESSSIRCFSSFNLFEVKLLETKCDRQPDDAQKKWYSYSCREVDNFDLTISHISAVINAKHLIGFNNTGNVCVWPSEEVLAYYNLKNSMEFNGTSVCELGGGMTSLAGLVVATRSEARNVLLSDGNETAVKNIESIIEQNRDKFGKTTVNSRFIRWDQFDTYKEYESKFDHVFCADCLFFRENVEELSNAMHYMLNENGTGLVVSPSRSGALRFFRDIAGKKFSTTEIEHYDDDVINKHKESKNTNPSYCEDLHFPLMLKLRKFPNDLSKVV